MYANDKDPRLTIRAKSADAPVLAGVEPTTPPIVVASVKGYRQLDAIEQALINQIKKHASETEVLIESVQTYLSAKNLRPEVERAALNPNRWAALAQTDLQTGFMKLVRAIAQPTSF